MMSEVPEPQTPRRRTHAMGNRVVCATPRRGKEISNYSLGDRLGKGAFATVYKAIHLRTAQVAAIKQIPLEKIKLVDTIMEEIELLQDLEHPNIVKYFGFMKDESNLNIVLEYCENGSLAMILHKFGKFPENLVAQYMRQVLEGLVYLHHQGIIHRDIKGANILTTKDGVAKLADFGVAMRIADSGEQMERPRAVGTPHWMAPEIIQMQEPTPACDIWSLAATIVELKSGQPPYGDRQDIPAMYAIVQQDSSAIIPADSSGSLRDFLTLCFEKTPDLRVTAEDLLKHLWIRKFGGDVRGGEVAVTYPEQAVKEWNSPSRRKRLAVPSRLNLRQGLKRANNETEIDPLSSSPMRSAINNTKEDNYEDDFASLSLFGDRQRTAPRGSLVPADPHSSKKFAPPSMTPPPKRTHLSDFVDSSSEQYDEDFEVGSLGIAEPIKKAPSFSGSSKGDPFLGLEDLLEDGPDEILLCAQQEANELARLASTNECDLVIAYTRLCELVLSIPQVTKTLDQVRLLPKSLSILSKTADGKGPPPEVRMAFLKLIDVCIQAEQNEDFVTNFCIAGGLSFVLEQSGDFPSMVLRLLNKMSDLSLADEDKMAIARQLAFREDAIAAVCSFFNEQTDPGDLLSASTIILNMFTVCGPRRRANLWHHFNAYGLFKCLVGLLHMDYALSSNNRLSSNLYSLIVSFGRTPQELLVEEVNQKILRRLMRAYIKLEAGNPHRIVLLEFFKNASTLVTILDAMQKGSVAPHLIAALRRAMHDPRVPPRESRVTVNCLVPALFNYSRINRYRQREVARYGLLLILQDCVRQYTSLREFAFPVFSALVHAGHEECWKALWEADALSSFIDLITESGWQAMAIAAVAAWIQAQPKLVGPKFIPHIGVINEALSSTSGGTFESVLSAVSSLFYENRYLCHEIPIPGLFDALKSHIMVSNTMANSASLLQSLQIVMWVLTADTKKAGSILQSSGLLSTIKDLGENENVPVPCKKLSGQIISLMKVPTK